MSKITYDDILRILIDNNNFYQFKYDFEGFRDFLIEQYINERPLFWDSLTYYRVYSIKKSLLNDFDAITVITGYEGSGKSVLASQIATTVSPSFHKGLVGYDPEDLARMVNDLQKGDTIWIDEGGLFLFSRDSTKGANKILIKFLTICRQLNVHVIICVPNFFILDTYLRDHRVKYLFHIVKNRKNFLLFKRDSIKVINYYGRQVKDVNRGLKYLSTDSAIKGTWTGDFGTTNTFSQKDYLDCKHENMKKFALEMQELLNKDGILDDDVPVILERRRTDDFIPPPPTPQKLQGSRVVS